MRPYHCSRPYTRNGLRWFTVASLLLVIGTASQVMAQLPPDEALKTLRPSEGLEIHLFAAEPLVNNPTCIDIDPQGRVWVCEGVNYRHSIPITSRPSPDPRADRVKVLEDTDGDGRAEKVTIFAEGLVVPMGVAVAGYETPGKGGKVYVAESPNLWVFTDEDGDLVPEKKEALLTGFGGRDHDHGLHGLVFGPDGRLYFTVGDEGMDVTDRSGNRVRPVAGAVCRVNLDGTDLTVLAENFRNPYEPAVDSFGEVFLSDNDIDGRRGVRICWVLEGGNYGWEGPPSPSGDHWREDLPSYVHKMLGTGTGSPCGMLVYEGALFGDRYVGALIHADAGPRVIRAYHLKPKGAGYECAPEVLVSSGDTWFRPVDVCVHPDGSIYIADWYDAGVGGHRYTDNNTGRIYRLLPKGKAPEAPEIDWNSGEGLVKALASPSVATRFIAFNRLAVEETSERLMTLWDRPKDQVPVRLQARAYWTLMALTTRGPVGLMLENPDRDVRLHALMVRTEHFPMLRLPVNNAGLLGLFGKVKHPHVQRELILAKSEPWCNLKFLVKQWDGQDHFYLAALGIALREREPEFIAELFQPESVKGREAKMVKLAWELQRPEAMPFLTRILEENRPDELKRSVLEALWHIRDPSAGEAVTAVVLNEEKPDLRRTALHYLATRLGGPWRDLRDDPELARALDAALAEPELTVPAIEVVARGQLSRYANRLIDLIDEDEGTSKLSPGYSLDVRLAAIRALGEMGAESALGVLRKQLQLGRIDMSKAHGLQPVGVDARRQPERASGAEQAALAADESLRAEQQLELATAAVDAIDALDTPSAQEMIRSVVVDAVYDNVLRQQAVRRLAHRPEGARFLLDLAASGRLPSELKMTAGLALRQFPAEEIRSRATELLPPPTSKTGRPLPPISELIYQRGDPDRGRDVFFRDGAEGALCARCHRVGNQGTPLGPDLDEIGSKLAPEALYDTILNPSAGIAHGYRSYSVVTTDGRIFSGLIVQESSAGIILKTAEGEQVEIPADRIEEKQPQLISLMPENLAATLTEQELVDLVAYLQSLREAKPESP